MVIKVINHMAFTQLKQRVWRANMGLIEAGLAVLSWGNASGVDRKAGVVAIKPTGVPYNNLNAEDIVVVSLATGEVLEGRFKPSTDTHSHLYIYRAFPSVGGIVHAHSIHATAFAQAQKDIHCLGTTHADSFYGSIPVTRPLTQQEIETDYEQNIGMVIEECFAQRNLRPDQVPAVLVSLHGPFTWGPTMEKALENAIVLEKIAQMAFTTHQLLNQQCHAISKPLMTKHFERRHAPLGFFQGSAIS